MRGRDQFSKYKNIIDLLEKIICVFPKKTRLKMLNRRRRMPGKIGMAIRYALLKSVAISCGDNVAIYEDVYFYNPQNLRIGNNVSLHPMCYVECGKSEELGLIIQDDVSIAHGVTIMSNTHQFKDRKIKIKDKLTITEQIVIESDVWIGAKATILSGNIIHSGSIIGAGAVVTKDVPPDSICVGIPAKVIRGRFE